MHEKMMEKQKEKMEEEMKKLEKLTEIKDEEYYEKEQMIKEEYQS